jgi:hypothetical protein
MSPTLSKRYRASWPRVAGGCVVSVEETFRSPALIVHGTLDALAAAGLREARFFRIRLSNRNNQ